MAFRKTMLAAGCAAAILSVSPVWAQATPIQVTAEIASYVSLSVGSSTITFVAPSTPGQAGYMSPSTGLDGNCGQGGAVDVVSAAAADRTGPGVAWLRATTNKALSVSMSPGSPLTLSGGTETLPTSFRAQSVGRYQWLAPIGDTGYKTYTGLESMPWIAAGAAPFVGYLDRGQVADLYLQAKIVRNGVADAPGLYTQPSPLTVTVADR